MDKFEIGDKVKLVQLDCTHPQYISRLDRFFKKAGTIVRRDADTKYLEVAFDDLIFSSFMLPDRWLELVEKAKKPWNGKVVCIESCDEYFTVGKVYEVKDGLLYDNIQNNMNPPFVRLTSVDDINDRYDGHLDDPLCPDEHFRYQFVEFKGEA